MRRIVSTTIVLSFARPLTAQQPSPHRTGMVISVGIAALADALSTQCGSHVNGGGGGGPEAGLAFLARLRHALVFQADTHIANQLDAFGCYLVGVPVDTEYSRSLRHDPLVRSTVRLGVETPPDTPLFRATIGAGAAWGGHTLPLAVFGLAWSSRGDGVRFLVSADRMISRVRAAEVHHAFPPQLVETRRSIIEYAGSTSVRIGVEVPLRTPPGRSSSP